MNIVLSVSTKIVLYSTGATLVLAGFTCDGKIMKEPQPIKQGVPISQTAKPAPDQPQWHVPTYQGLVLGKSTKADVERTFGRPIWSGPPEDKLISNDPENELLYEYNDVGGIIGQITLVLGARTQIVKAIDIYPQQPLTIQQVIRQYGDKYIERESKLGPCPTESEMRSFKPSKNREYPIFLVYPQQGMYISVSEAGTIPHIGYLIRCP